MGALDLVDWPADQVLSLSGAAGSLKIPFTLRNASAEAVQVIEASFAEVRSADSGAPLRLDPAPLRMNVAANDALHGHIRLRLDPATPPGRYQGAMTLSGVTRTVDIEVLARAELAVRPEPVLVDAAAGRAQQVRAAFENRGNVQLTIDLSGRYPLGEEIPIAPDRLARPVEGLARLGEAFGLASAAAPLLKEVGFVDIAMPAGPLILGPGDQQTVPLALTLPEALAPVARHHVFAPVYGADLHIIIVTAAKARPRARSARRTQGASG
jgi:hypothetical protein